MLAKQLSAAAAAAEPVFIESVFSTYLYTGNGSTQTITNGIDLAGKGGLVWNKSRSNAYIHCLTDTARGVGNSLDSSDTAGNDYSITRISAFNADGFTMGGNSRTNASGATYASWTFRKQPKFFDVVTYTGDGAASRTISHNLQSKPGFVVVKRTDSTGDWWTLARKSDSGDTRTYSFGIRLNLTNAQNFDFSYTGDTSTSFPITSAGTGLNVSGATYVAYFFAHNAGGFGLSGTDNVISCGSYSGTGALQTISLGYEAQWVLIKRVDSENSWYLFDNMRGLSMTQCLALLPNGSNSELDYGTQVGPSATGFTVNNNAAFNASGGTYIYIAIRRGPMKTPTSGTSVYYGLSRSGTGAAANITGCPFVPDLVMAESRNVSAMTSGASAVTRLQGSYYLKTASTAAEISSPSNSFSNWLMNGYSVGGGASDWNDSSAGTVYMNWMIGRAPGFFDVVCYTGTGSARTVAHNLGVVPELMIVKKRSAADAWIVYANNDNTDYLVLNTTAATVDNNTIWNDTSPTSSVFTVGTNDDVNGNTATFVAYLFATCPGVSKVGSYTGSGTTKQIDCGFTGGARFVLIKRTDSTGDWYVWDSARGIVGLFDPYLLLNSTAAEVTNTDYVDTYAQGFEISSFAPAAINASGGSFIFFAVA